MSADLFNARLRRVSDVDEPRDTTRPVTYVVLGALMLVFGVAAWITDPWGAGSIVFSSMAAGGFVLAHGLGALLRHRRQSRWGHPSPESLLDAAPIELVDLRWPIALHLVPFGFYLASGAARLSRGELWLGSLEALLGALGLLALLRRCLRLPSLHIDASGFTGLPSGSPTSWRDVSRIRVDPALGDSVAYDLAETSTERKRRLFGGGRERWVRAHGPIPPEKLAELLNAARDRWG